MDLVQFSGQERVDLADLSYGLNQVPTGLVNELNTGFLSAAGDTSIVQGFRPGSVTANGPVSVGQDGVLNTAWLASADGSTVTYGVFCAGGTAAQNVDISTFAPGEYVIYVRFNRAAGEPQNRAFWSSVDGAEYAKLTNTRITGSWEVRIETAQPSPEWLAIGSATITSGGQGQGNLVSVIDKRPLYFEGTYAGLYRPTWGSAADRGQIRRDATLTSLRRTIDALKACLVDIKGAGVATWYQSFITGLNVGPSFPLGTAVAANTIALGDPTVRFVTSGAYTSYPSLAIYFGNNDYLNFDAYSGFLSRVSYGTQAFAFSSSGYLTIGLNTTGGPLTVNSTSNFGGGEMAAFFNRGSGQSRGSVWGQNVGEVSAAWQLGFVSEWPNPRVLWNMGVVGGYWQTGLLCNLQGTGLYYYGLKIVCNSTAANDFTTYLQTKNVTLGSSGLTQINGADMRIGAARVSPGSLGLASGVVTVRNAGGGTIGFPSYQAAPGYGSVTAQSYPTGNSVPQGAFRYTRLSFSAALPSNATILCSMLRYTQDGADQKDWQVTFNQADNYNVDFVITDGNNTTQWGSFSFLILNSG